MSLRRSQVYQIQQHHKDFSICNINLLALKIVIIASVTKLESDKAEKGQWTGRKYSESIRKEYIDNVKMQAGKNRDQREQLNYIKGVTFATFTILVRKTISTTSENEWRPKVLGSLSSFMPMMYCGYSFLYEENFSYNQVIRPPRKIEKCFFCFLFTTKSPFFKHFKKRFYSSKILLSGDDPICFFVCFWKGRLSETATSTFASF